jgi:formylmethanofuran dehydrogenase subunit D
MNHPYSRIFTFATFFPVSSNEIIYNNCQLLVEVYPLKKEDYVKTIQVCESNDKSLLTLTLKDGQEIKVYARKMFVL